MFSSNRRVIKVSYQRQGTIVAEYRLSCEARFDLEVDGMAPRDFLEWLRAAPREYVDVTVRYPLVNRDNIILFNQKGVRNMDIDKYLASKKLEVSAKERPLVEQGHVKHLFLCPDTDRLPDDGFLQFVRAEKIFDLDKIPERSVVVIATSLLPALKTVAANPLLFDLQLSVLTGVPLVEYTSDFDSAVWNLEKRSYIDFISTLSVHADADAQLVRSKATQFDKEQAKITRDNGEVKELKNFSVHDVRPVSDASSQDANLEV